MNDLVENPFGGSGRPNESAGTRQVQARENTEVMALAMMAKRFPRDVVKATDKILNAFTRATLASKAQYQYARGGSDITGPSIRAAEAISQQWGNMSSGWRELSRTVGADGVGQSEVEAYCIDYESTSRESIQFFVRHWRDTKKGGYALKDERDIYELCANQAARRKRACILAQIPGDIIEAAMDQVSVTLANTADVSPEGVKKLEAAFLELGVTKEQIEKRIQRRLDAIQPAQVVSLKRVYASLRDDMSTVSDWFEVGLEAAATSTGLEAVREAAAAKKAGKKSGARDAPPPASGNVGAAPAIDQESGEIFASTQAPPAQSYAQLADTILQSPTQDEAAIALDLARGLPGTQYDELRVVYLSKWS